jgi:hypothetical protein
MAVVAGGDVVSRLYVGARPERRRAPGEEAAIRVGRWIGSWPFAVGTLVLVTAAAVLTARRAGPSVAVLDVVVGGLVLAELPLLFMAVRHAHLTAAEFAGRHDDADKLQAAELRELSDTVAGLTVELARLNARLRTAPSSMRKDPDR